jgi:hypothetical protein
MSMDDATWRCRDRAPPAAVEQAGSDLEEAIDTHLLPQLVAGDPRPGVVDGEEAPRRSPMALDPAPVTAPCTGVNLIALLRRFGEDLENRREDRRPRGGTPRHDVRCERDLPAADACARKAAVHGKPPSHHASPTFFQSSRVSTASTPASMLATSTSGPGGSPMSRFHPGRRAQNAPRVHDHVPLSARSLDPADSDEPPRIRRPYAQHVGARSWLTMPQGTRHRVPAHGRDRAARWEGPCPSPDARSYRIGHVLGAVAHEGVSSVARPRPLAERLVSSCARHLLDDRALGGGGRTVDSPLFSFATGGGEHPVGGGDASQIDGRVRRHSAMSP